MSNRNIHTNRHDENDDTHESATAHLSQIIDLLAVLIAETKRGNAISEMAAQHKKYWTAEDIALQIGKSKSTVQSHYTCKPNFPPARRLPANKGRGGHPIWLASEVLRWIEKHKER